MPREAGAIVLSFFTYLGYDQTANNGPPLVEALWSVHTLYLQSNLELEGAIQTMAIQIHVWEHSRITLLAALIAREMIRECSIMERSAKCKYFLVPVFLQFGLASGQPWAT